MVTETLPETKLEVKQALKFGEAPPEGVYYDVPAEIYHSWPGCSASRLKDLRQSPMHAWYKMTHPEEKEPSAALVKGTAIHAAILEPEKFEQEYAPSCQCEAFTGKGGDSHRCTNQAKGQQRGIWLCGVHGKGGFENSQIILDADFHAACLQIQGIVRNHRTVREFFACQHHVEVSAVWTDDDYGIPCKLRSDFLCPELATVLDVKTVEDASPAELEKQIWNYDYHIQNQFYLRGLRQLKQDYRYFLFIAVEKSAPYGVAVYTLDQSALEAAAYHLNQYLSQWAECAKNQYWPGYPDGLNVITLPRYAKNEIFKTA